MFEDIFLDGILVDVDVSFWSGAKALKAEDLGLKPEDIAEAYKLGRKLLIPQEVIRSFRRIEGKARRIVDENSFPFPIGSARFVPKKKFKGMQEKLEEYKRDYDACVDELIQNYDRYRSEMMPIYEEAAERAFINTTPTEHTFGPEYDREKLREDFKAQFLSRINSFYPPAESLRTKFSLVWNVYEIAMPRMEQTTGEDVVMGQERKEIAQDEYRRQMQEKIGGFISDVVSAMRKETAEICDRIALNIKDGKVIRGKTIQSLKDFVDRFKELNFVGDTYIEEQLNSLRKQFLDIYPTKKIHEEPELRQELGRRLHELSEAAVNMTDINSVTGQYQRKISWQDEDRGNDL